MTDEEKALARKLADEYWKMFVNLVEAVAKSFFITGFKLGGETKRKRGGKK